MRILSPLWDSTPNKHFFSFSAPHATTTLPQPAEALNRPILPPQPCTALAGPAVRLGGATSQSCFLTSTAPIKTFQFRGSPPSESVPSSHPCLTTRQPRRRGGQTGQGSISAASSRQVTSAGFETVNSRGWKAGYNAQIDPLSLRSTYSNQCLRK